MKGARHMDDELDELLESEERLRVWTAWLGRTLEGTVNTALWRGDSSVFFFETDDAESMQSSETIPACASSW
jgi:hypothetical protein